MFATSLAYLATVTLRIPPPQTGGLLETEGGRKGLRHRGGQGRGRPAGKGKGHREVARQKKKERDWKECSGTTREFRCDLRWNLPSEGASRDGASMGGGGKALLPHMHCSCLDASVHIHHILLQFVFASDVASACSILPKMYSCAKWLEFAQNGALIFSFHPCTLAKVGTPGVDYLLGTKSNNPLLLSRCEAQTSQFSH